MVELPVIFFFVAMVIVIPVFVFMINIGLAKITVDRAAEKLDISALSTFTAINSDTLGSGAMEFDKEKAREIYFLNFENMIRNFPNSNMYSKPQLEISVNEGIVAIESHVTVTVFSGIPVTVTSSIDFVLDPATEDFQ